MSWACKTYRRFGQMAILGRALPGLALVIGLGACAATEESQLEPPLVPVGAIQVSAELYMVPAGADAVGCPMFQPWSPTLMVVQALHWRSADGTFTLDRNVADCPPAT